MFKIIYAVVEERMPEGFVDNLVFAKDEYEMMLFGTVMQAYRLRAKII